MNEEEKHSRGEKHLWPGRGGGRERLCWGSCAELRGPDQWSRTQCQAGETGAGQKIRLFRLHFILRTVEGGCVPCAQLRCILESACLKEFGAWAEGGGETEGTYHYLEAVARWEVTGA